MVTIGLDRSVRVLKVIGFSERRGDATAARVLYEDLQARARNNYLQCKRPVARKRMVEGAVASLAAAVFLRYATPEN